MPLSVNGGWTGNLLRTSPLTSQTLPELGAPVAMNLVNAVGALPTRNFQLGKLKV